jgi:gluconolactonase
VTDADFTEVANGLRFPEGPVAMPDGSVVVAEMFGERVTRVGADGATSVIAEIRGGPNGLAVGPDGALYVCNNGGSYTPFEIGGLLLPGAFDRDRYSGGLIQRLDLDGTVIDLYTNCDGRPLRSPNDLVMDGHGGFYFSDHGIHDVVGARTADLGSLYYARCDGSDIHESPTRCTRRTGSASVRTARSSTTPRRTPAASSAGASPSRACSRR